MGEESASGPVQEALHTLAAMLLDPDGAGRRPLALVYLKYVNTFAAWPRHVREYLEGSLTIAISVVWRKLAFFWKQYPWCLVPAFDLRRSLADRRATLQAMLDGPDCWIDPGLCKVLRASLPMSTIISTASYTTSWSRSLSGL